MSQQIATVALVVRDYDEAIAFYVGTLGFDLVEDADLGDRKRWVLVAPPGGGTRLLLARAADDRQAAQRARKRVDQQVDEDRDGNRHRVIACEPKAGGDQDDHPRTADRRAGRAWGCEW